MMLHPATQYIVNHIYIAVVPKMIRLFAKTRPPLKTKLQYFSALRNMDSFSINGGYVPSYVAPSVVGKPKFVPMANWRWYVESKEGGTGSVRQSGGGIGKLDAANEDGFFFKLNRSRLRKLKELLKEKGELKKKETPPDKKLYEIYE